MADTLGDTLRERRIAARHHARARPPRTTRRSAPGCSRRSRRGDYDRLPNPGYVRGYISSYARYLELDAEPLLAMYRAETGAGRFHDIDASRAPTVSRAHEQHAITVARRAWQPAWRWPCSGPSPGGSSHRASVGPNRQAAIAPSHTDGLGVRDRRDRDAEAPPAAAATVHRQGDRRMPPGPRRSKATSDRRVRRTAATTRRWLESKTFEDHASIADAGEIGRPSRRQVSP